MKVGDWVLTLAYVYRMMKYALFDPRLEIAQIENYSIRGEEKFFQLRIPFNEGGRILRFESEIISIAQIPYDELGIYLSQMDFSSGQKLLELLNLGLVKKDNG